MFSRQSTCFFFFLVRVANFFNFGNVLRLAEEYAIQHAQDNVVPVKVEDDQGHNLELGKVCRDHLGRGEVLNEELVVSVAQVEGVWHHDNSEKSECEKEADKDDSILEFLLVSLFPQSSIGDEKAANLRQQADAADALVHTVV